MAASGMRAPVILLYISVSSLLITEILCDYWTDRANFIKSEQSFGIGSKLILSHKEEVVNKLLMTAKRLELKKAFLHPETFPPARHFFQAKHDIEKSAVFSFISKMPKGGALHVHDVALSSLDYLLYNVTYRDNLYGCVTQSGIKLKFSSTKPKEDTSCWILVKTMRSSAKSAKMFDGWLAQKLTLVTDNPSQMYPDINSVWKVFSGLFETITPMITYKPVFMDYIYNFLEEFHRDNVNYVEIRTTIPAVYDLDGKTYNSVQIVGFLKQVADQFMKDYPEFIGIKYIFAPGRGVDNTTMHNYLNIFKEIRTKYPEFVVGFDLVGQEDSGQPLSAFVNELSTANDVKFFFHAGETNWDGLSTDLNLIDAVLLNTTRIGHGYALVKHPSVLKEIKNRGIAVEVNPISNQVLNLVKDIRNHPAQVFFAENYPVVVSSDDPGMWGAKGLSHDFYQAFMGMMSAETDLRALKALALNSFHYNALSPVDKGEAIKKFTVIWDKFISDMYTLQSDYVLVYKV